MYSSDIPPTITSLSFLHCEMNGDPKDLAAFLIREATTGLGLGLGLGLGSGLGLG